jgi:hypothetical protein
MHLMYADDIDLAVTDASKEVGLEVSAEKEWVCLNVLSPDWRRESYTISK